MKLSMKLSPTVQRRLRGASRSRLSWLGAALVIAGAVQANIDVFSALLTPPWQGVLTALVGIAVIALRAATRVPLEDR